MLNRKRMNSFKRLRTGSDSSSKRRLISLFIVFFGVLLVCLYGLATLTLAGDRLFSKDENRSVGVLHTSTSTYQHREQHLLDKVTKCTPDQMETIAKQLKLEKCKDTEKFCPISVATRCPKNSWLEDYFKESFAKRADSSFLGISIGCNKGFDAIDTARMGMNNPKFDRTKWFDSMSETKDIEEDNGLNGVCMQGTQPQFDIVSNDPIRSGEMYCVEPLPNTYQDLVHSAGKLGLSPDEFVVSNAAVSSSNGVVLFPNAKSGLEWLSIATCESDPSNCKDVSMYSLETYMNKFVKSKGPINILSIDVEGFDFDVLFGGGDAFERVEYLEFEFHETGNWGSYHLMDAIRLLDGKGFTCYWAGMEYLWRLTGCDHDAYETLHLWSNVACVHRSQDDLATRMENLFLETLAVL